MHLHTEYGLQYSKYPAADHQCMLPGARSETGHIPDAAGSGPALLYRMEPRRRDQSIENRRASITKEGVPKELPIA